MGNKLLFSKPLLIILVAGLILPGISNAAVERTFFDDFSSTFSIDLNQTSAQIKDGRVSLSGNSFSNQVVSGTVILTIDPIVEAFVSASDFKSPPDTRIIYYVSNDNGRNWIQVEPGFWHEFSIPGNQLKWKAVLAKEQAGLTSPYIDSVSIIARSDSKILKRSRDQQRISDLERVRTALEKFRADWKTYPYVDAQNDEFRWKQLEQILIRTGFDGVNYIFNFPQDPLRTDLKFKWSYDYKNIGSDQYVLAAKLEDFNTAYFGKVVLVDDLDGQIESINCNDPVYCIGKTSQTQTQNSNQNASVFNFRTSQTSQTQTSTNQSNRVSRIFRPALETTEERHVATTLASLYGGLLGVFGPSVTQTSQTQITRRNETSAGSAAAGVSDGTDGDSQSASLLSKIFSKRPRLVREVQTGNIYEIAIGQRHWIPNQTVFNEYGFDSKKIESISRTELLVYPRAKILRVNEDRENRIYYLTETGYIRPIPNMDVFHSYGDRIEDVIEISQTEFLSYPRSKYVAIDPNDPTADDPLVKGKVWQIEGNAKRLASESVMKKLGIQKKEIGPVNRTELDYYEELEALN